jgi:hypothetical protein
VVEHGLKQGGAGPGGLSELFRGRSEHGELLVHSAFEIGTSRRRSHLWPNKPNEARVKLHQ